MPFIFKLICIKLDPSNGSKWDSFIVNSVKWTSVWCLFYEVLNSCLNLHLPILHYRLSNRHFSMLFIMWICKIITEQFRIHNIVWRNLIIKIRNNATFRVISISPRPHPLPRNNCTKLWMTITPISKFNTDNNGIMKRSSRGTWYDAFCFKIHEIQTKCFYFLIKKSQYIKEILSIDAFNKNTYNNSRY